MGLTLADFDLLTIGMLMDLLITNNNEQCGDKEEKVIEANQGDFDNF